MALPRSLRALAPFAPRSRQVTTSARGISFLYSRPLPATFPLSSRFQSPLMDPRRAAGGEAGEWRTTCDGPPLPPCPGCPPKKTPPCRCPKPERMRAQRLICCPPPGGMRPPCQPRLPACPLTCDRLLAAAVAAASSSPQVYMCSTLRTL